MSEARLEILSNIRKSLTAGEPKTSQRTSELRARLKGTAPQIQPRFAEDNLTRFCEKHVAVHGTYELIKSVDIEAAVIRYLQGLEIDPQIHLGAGPCLDQLEWPEGVFTYKKSADKNTRVAVSEAFAAVAETGTLVMCSGSDLLPSHNFLPDDHIVIADCERIVRYQEDVWSLLRVDDHFPQRAVNLITGPSKTGDIEQTIQYGAHGPRRLHVLIVKD